MNIKSYLKMCNNMFWKYGVIKYKGARLHECET